MILLSFGFTAALNEGVVRNTFYSSLHSLVIFIVLGIAADDIFVFVDAWRQSAHIKMFKGNDNMRLAYSFRRAARATAITSSTTSVAFLANVFSPIMPIASFGIYAAIIISANYLLIIMIFPPVIIFWERHLSNRNWICMKRDETVSQVEKIDGNPEDEKEEFGKMEMFFSEDWDRHVKKFSIPIVVLFMIWTVISAIFASRLTPLSKEEEFLPADHQLSLITELVEDNYNGGLINLAIDIYWGVKGINKDETNRWDPVYIGEVIWDDEFDLTPIEN